MRKNIERLVLFAGPRGSGKTSLLDEPYQRLSADLQDHPLMGSIGDCPKENVENWGEEVLSEHETLWLHVDLSKPLTSKCYEPRGRDDLRQLLTAELYHRWKNLSEWISVASSVQVVTFYVDREVNFHRLVFGRKLGKEKGRKAMNSKVAAVVGDQSNQSELHRLLYRAWLDLADSLNSTGELVIDGNEDVYHVISRRTLDQRLS